MLRTRSAVLGLALLVSGACVGRGCFQSQTPPYPQWQRVTEADGREYRVVERGAYRAFYDPSGRPQRIEFDSNDDGKADHIAYHDGAEKAQRLEIDTDFDGRIDRWEHYDREGRLLKVGSSRRGGTPERWAHLGPDSLPVRMEYDSDRDGRIERVEVFEAGRLVRVETDADRDGRVDRWQDWRSGLLGAEDFDTDGDGKPDRRLRYGTNGEVETFEPLKKE